MIGRLEQALAASKADQGLIVTTSLFTEAARERARGLPVALYDREDVGAWIGKWCTPFSRLTQKRPWSYTPVCKLRHTSSHSALPSCWISSLKAMESCSLFQVSG